jgi:hypothetical protein
MVMLALKSIASSGMNTVLFRMEASCWEEVVGHELLGLIHEAFVKTRLITDK